VNPVVAVVIGYFIGGEAVGPRAIIGTLFVLVSVVVITTTPQKVVRARELGDPKHEPMPQLEAKRD
jgi:drug/metabolite transporter (DMT)-like permease